MKEHPIIFSTEMIKAILDGKKTQTRRVMKPQPNIVLELLDWGENLFVRTNLLERKPKHSVLNGCIKFPYGQVGDRLWVRETCDYVFGDEGDYILYKANDDDLKHFEKLKKAGIKVTWKPSIFMPRDLSRITLEITEVRVERLQDISLKDVYLEGMRNPVFHKGSIGSDFSVLNVIFPELWDKLNAKRGYSWESNPWVWGISFKVTL